MKQVSQAYVDSMSSRLRDVSYVWVELQAVDPDAEGDGAWVTNGIVDYTNISTLGYEYEYGSPYGSLELNRFVLSGDYRLPVKGDVVNDGYISSQVSSATTGKFSTKPTMTREFSVPRNLPGITVWFDTRTEVHPRTMTVKSYNNNALVEETTIDVVSVIATVEIVASEVDKIVLEFDGGLPAYRCRVERILFGYILEFTNDDVVDCVQVHDIDPLSRRLPSEEFSVTILDFEQKFNNDNPEGAWGKIIERSPISVRYGYTLPDGSIEKLSPDNYILSSKPTSGKNEVTFSATGLVGDLTGAYRKDVYGEKSLYDLAEAVLLDTGLPLTIKGENPWVIHESLKDMYTTAVLEINTHANCLQIIAHAANCMFYTDDENIVHIEPFNITSAVNSKSDFVVDFDSIGEDSIIASRIDQLKAVEVNMYSNIESSEVTSIAELSTTDTEVVIDYSGLAVDVVVTVDGGVVEYSEIYGRSCYLLLSSGEKNVKITGRRVENSSSITTFNVALTGEIDVEENPLITNVERRDAFANHTIEYLLYRNTYSFNYRGNPELETKDVISIQTHFSDSITSVVLTDTLNFNGALSGSLTLKGLNS